ncbi:nucleotidyl transferase AbiEii/AbiGii toxin family protein [Polycyclovorans algicola]|uniref:nucleotidyl transferase AbiEii/AbiGii toxin family protein n=1 Tax=Polycyclovorans algicola TaxID=616992 RepID=UPI0004A6D8FB|nr:nucleotidyl transferase AbiEii/AbiGii toxin family protein [Polycyclovorans algicola]
MSRNLAASIRARLKNVADARKQDFNLVLTHYGLERLLYRLSVSPHAPNFLLKGALLFTLWYDTPHRPTRDVDLLGYGPDDIGSVVAVFQDICRIAFEDGIEFDPQQVFGNETRKEAGYGGVRIELPATLDGARLTLQVDIGFGDAVTPAPEAILYPVLLSDLPPPQLRAYPKYTVVAEKFHAICLLGLANSRMKDYFDLWILLREGTLDLGEMKRAIDATFARRRMTMPVVLPVGLSNSFALDASKQMQWRAFLRKNRLEALELVEIVQMLRNAFTRAGIIGP